MKSEVDYCDRCLELERSIASLNDSVRELSDQGGNPSDLSDLLIEIKLIRGVLVHHRREAHKAATVRTARKAARASAGAPADGPMEAAAPESEEKHLRSNPNRELEDALLAKKVS